MRCLDRDTLRRLTSLLLWLHQKNEVWGKTQTTQLPQLKHRTWQTEGELPCFTPLASPVYPQWMQKSKGTDSQPLQVLHGTRGLNPHFRPSSLFSAVLLAVLRSWLQLADLFLEKRPYPTDHFYKNITGKSPSFAALNFYKCTCIGCIFYVCWTIHTKTSVHVNLITHTCQGYLLKEFLFYTQVEITSDQMIA